MRASSSLRLSLNTIVRQRMSADPWATHASDTSPFWKKVREALVVNPDISSGNPLVRAHRQPEPASREEKFSVPASKSSDVAQNPYWKRDNRRQYPMTEVLQQSDLSALLITQGGINSYVDRVPFIPSIAAPSSPPSTKALVDGSAKIPSLSSLFVSASPASSTEVWKPPIAPGLKLKWAPSKEVVPSNPDVEFPMVNYSSYTA
ncbi:BQ5605_C025g10046 [Microbotryum silenes-dioicae]|uniref:BQ5605_C025g10046 protein n=1 Tax=Microbotryum silenes-dioicae TaxID=796604 RepID=A0A2X0MMF2_9BASI|nr:BQ5605_C025g10046 [Microbotryum silenes-dioicae]